MSARFQLPLRFVFVFVCKSSSECGNYALGGPPCEKGWEILFCTCERYTVEIICNLLVSKRLLCDSHGRVFVVKTALGL